MCHDRSCCNYITVLAGTQAKRSASEKKVTHARSIERAVVYEITKAICMVIPCRCLVSTTPQLVTSSGSSSHKQTKSGKCFKRNTQNAQGVQPISCSRPKLHEELAEASEKLGSNVSWSLSLSCWLCRPCCREMPEMELSPHPIIYYVSGASIVCFKQPESLSL